MKEFIRKFLDEFKNTGERPILNTKFEKIGTVLQFSYEFASKKIKKDYSILDYGCGGGYGTEYLSRFTEKKTTGFDIDEDTINANKKFYKGIRKLEFTSNEGELEQYDLITSFQVIEHLEFNSGKKYLLKIKKALKKDGVFLLATVNKNITSYNLKKPIMPFHIYEYNPDELKKLLEKFYKSVACFGQIDHIVQKKVNNFNWSFIENKKTINEKMLFFISQIEIVRVIARHLPVFIKNMFFGEKRGAEFPYRYNLTKDKKEIDNSYILIYECRNI